jgi:hypothetical protein
MSPTSEQRPTDESQERRAFGAGYELWIGLAVGLYVVYAVTDLITGLVYSEVSLSVDFEDDAVSALDVPHGSASLSGLTEISVSTGDVSTGAVVFVIIAKIALILTVLGAAISLVPVIRDIAAGTPFTARASRAFSVLTWIVLIGWIIYFITMMLGSNWIAADIGIGDGVGPGITVMQSWLVLGIIGGAELLRRCFRSGRRAQEELEGLV